MVPKTYHRDWNRKQSLDWHTERNAYRAELRRKRKTEAIQLKGGKCNDCGQVFPPCCFDFHHLDPLQDNISPSKILHYRWERVMKELEGCILLCANCHRLRHDVDGYIAHTKREL